MDKYERATLLIEAAMRALTRSPNAPYFWAQIIDREAAYIAIESLVESGIAAHITLDDSVCIQFM